LSTRHFTLLLYGGHAPFTIKAHRSRGAVRPDLRKVAVTRLLPTRVGWLAPYGPDFLGRHPDARLCGRGGWFFLGWGILWGFLSWFFLFLDIFFVSPDRLKLAGEILYNGLA